MQYSLWWMNKFCFLGCVFQLINRSIGKNINNHAEVIFIQKLTVTLMTNIERYNQLCFVREDTINFTSEIIIDRAFHLYLGLPYVPF